MYITYYFLGAKYTQPISISANNYVVIINGQIKIDKAYVRIKQREEVMKRKEVVLDCLYYYRNKMWKITIKIVLEHSTLVVLYGMIFHAGSITDCQNEFLTFHTNSAISWLCFVWEVTNASLDRGSM